MVVIVCDECDYIIRHNEAAKKWKGKWRHRRCPDSSTRSWTGGGSGSSSEAPESQSEGDDSNGQ